MTDYFCPDCGWVLTTNAYRIRCGRCGSLNLERKLPDGRYIKADADENAPENARLIHSLNTVPCARCNDILVFTRERGYVHKSTGLLYAQRPDGSDDHCAMPKRS